eukprot:TRINITY_DN24171_c0_g1_i3.p2 TRINITY_DN24171_c0_g1~~TRINITY_DN24171_c0_g1_i3.p2  ORF type:complete len:170 (+),score=25.92 TRINITY_DN24171_c0_g1_i3:135-644(+)
MIMQSTIVCKGLIGNNVATFLELAGLTRLEATCRAAGALDQAWPVVACQALQGFETSQLQEDLLNRHACRTVVAGLRGLPVRSPGEQHATTLLRLASLQVARSLAVAACNARQACQRHWQTYGLPGGVAAVLLVFPDRCCPTKSWRGRPARRCAFPCRRAQERPMSRCD